MLVTVTFSPGFTVSSPEKAKPLMVMPLVADVGADVVVPEEVGGGVVVLVFADELHEASRMSSAAAPATSGYRFGFISVLTLLPARKFTLR
jgi:hypothetical protein